MKHRLFTGTFIDKALTQFLYNELKEDFSKALFGKWVEPENLHFTYQFIGEVESKQAIDIKGALKDYLRTYQAPLKIASLGVFPNLRNPRILFVKVENPEGVLYQVNSEMENIIREFGYKPGHDKFTPHITLQRIKTLEYDKFKEVFDRNKDIEFGTMPEFSVNLIESQLTPRGPFYRDYK